MRYYKRLDIYKASNVTFDPSTYEAYSYGWWLFVTNIGDKVVLNNYNYSRTTNNHQQKVKRLLKALNIEIDIYIEAPQGLDRLSEAINHYNREIVKLELTINKPRTHKKKNEERKQLIKVYKDKISTIEELISIKNSVAICN